MKSFLSWAVRKWKEKYFVNRSCGSWQLSKAKNEDNLSMVSPGDGVVCVPVHIARNDEITFEKFGSLEQDEHGRQLYPFEMVNKLENALGVSRDLSAVCIVISVLLTGMGLFSVHWVSWTRGGTEVRHEGLWMTCTNNLTSHLFECVKIEYDSHWLLSVQILEALGFIGVILSAIINMIYHLKPVYRKTELAGWYSSSCWIEAFLLFVGLVMYGVKSTTRTNNLEKLLGHGDTVVRLSWGFTIHVIGSLLCLTAGLLSMCGLKREGYVPV